jgi:ankyrin repeat protein
LVDKRKTKLYTVFQLNIIHGCEMHKAKEIIESIESALRVDERYIVNIDQVEEFVQSWIKKAKRQETKTWVKNALRKYLINDYLGAYAVAPSPFPSNLPDFVKDAFRRGELVYKVPCSVDVVLSEEIDLILDYFDSPDGPKRPEAILFDDALKKAKQWEASLKKEFRDREDPTEVKVIKKVGKYQWVQILGRTGLDREGDLMHHCLSEKTYDSNCNYYSLRDEDNKPHATFEIKSNHTLLQIKGYKNGPIETNLKNLVLDFMEYLKLEFVESEGGRDDLEQNGWNYTNLGLELITHEDLDDENEDDYDDEEDRTDYFQVIADHFMHDWYGNVGQFLTQLRDYEDHGGNIDGTDSYGDTLLHIACSSSRGNYVNWLLTAGADPNVVNHEEGYTPLFTAVHKNSQDCVIALVEEESLDINWQDKNGQTVLMFALDQASRGHGVSYHMFSLLLDRDDIDTEKKDNRGYTALFYLVNYAEEVDLKRFLQLKPNVNVKAKDGLTPLIAVARRGRNDLLKMLIEYGADLENQGKEAYEAAKRKQNVIVMKTLINLGVKPE